MRIRGAVQKENKGGQEKGGEEILEDKEHVI